MLYGQNQDYLYYAKEAHCYLLEIWMAFGILGIISFIFIIAITIQNGQKKLKTITDLQERRNIIAIIVGTSIIVIHSLMDFDMSFLIIEMIFYIFIAIINIEDKTFKLKSKILEIVVILIFIIIGIGNMQGLIAQIFEDNTAILSNKIAPWVSKYKYNKIVYIENNKIDDENKINYIKQYINTEPYQYQNIMYEIMCNQIKKDVNLEDIEYLIDIWKNIKRERTYDIIQIQKRAEIMIDFSKYLIENAEETKNEEMKTKAKEILKIIVEEYEPNKKIILDYKRNREIESITKFKEQNYTKIYKEAIKLLEK